jgi:dihydroxyacetone kinase
MGFEGADVVTQFIEGLAETYPGVQYLDGFPEVRRRD